MIIWNFPEARFCRPPPSLRLPSAISNCSRAAAASPPRPCGGCYTRGRGRERRRSSRSTDPRVSSFASCSRCGLSTQHSAAPCCGMAARSPRPAGPELRERREGGKGGEEGRSPAGGRADGGNPPKKQTSTRCGRVTVRSEPHRAELLKLQNAMTPSGRRVSDSPPDHTATYLRLSSRAGSYIRSSSLASRTSTRIRCGSAAELSCSP